MQKVLIFALLLSGLFFSSPSYATSTGTCAIGTPVDGVGCVTPASSGKLWASATSFKGTSFTAKNKSLAIAQSESCSWYLNVSASSTTSSFRECTSGRSYRYKECQYAVINGQTQCTYNGSYQSGRVPGSDYETPVDYYCPPDDPKYSDFGILYKPNPTTNLCQKGFDLEKPSTCPTAPDGNNYFHVGQKGGGKVCLENDQGDSCPYKEEGTSGFYTADYSDPTSCQDTPPDPPNDNKDCSPNGAGQMVCNADPDEKCQSKNGLLVCQDGCGFMNGVFKCFKEPPKPEEPEEPEQPEVPDPPIDDNITDPDKPLADMTKADLKSTYRGIETRLESTKKELEDVQKKNDQNTKGIVSAINNVGRKVDKTNENLESAFKGEKFDEKGLADEADIKAGLGITGSEKITDLKNGEISIDSFKSSFAPFLSSSQCPPPRSISIMGKSYQLDWDPFCQFFTALGYLVMATAYILVPFIVFGGKK